jgi:hypothetical protein
MDPYSLSATDSAFIESTTASTVGQVVYSCAAQIENATARPPNIRAIAVKNRLTAFGAAGFILRVSSSKSEVSEEHGSSREEVNCYLVFKNNFIR